MITKLRRWWPELLSAAIIISLLFWRLDWTGMLGDEAAYAVRSWRWVDFLFSPYQTTPWQWYNPLPWWVFLSFHDAPPLAFWWQHGALTLFGASTWAARLPGALAGIGVAALVYDCLRQTFSRRTAVVGLLILATLTPFYWLQRTALLEPTMMLWIMLAIAAFLRAAKQPRWYLAVGAALGLALLTKYTALFVLPALLIIIIWRRRSALKQRQVWSGVGLMIILQYPVLLYNLLMYKSRGHADVQIAALLRQTNRDWPILSTQVSTSWWQSLVSLGQNVTDLYAWPMIILIILVLVLLGLKKVWRQATNYWLLLGLLALGWIVFMLLTRQDARFIATGYIFVPLLVAPLVTAWSYQFRWHSLIVVLLLVISLFYNLQTNYLPQQWGSVRWAYSVFHGRGYGLLATEHYLAALTAGHQPDVLLQDDYYRQFDPRVAKEKIFDFTADASVSKEPVLSDIIIYDQRINWFAEIWYFKRIFYFQRFMVISTRDLVKFHEQFPQEYLDITSGKNFHYFQITDSDLIDKVAGLDSVNTQAEKLLTASGETMLPSPTGQSAFKLYTGVFPVGAVPKP